MATLQPRPAPKEGIRKLAPRAPSTAVAAVLQERHAEPVAPAALVPASVPPAPPPRKVDTAAKPKPPPGAVTRHVPAAVRREVWKRDGGTCSWKSEDGRRCGSTWQVEVDHVVPPMLGGSSDSANLRLLCRRHNVLHAEHVYGREHMNRFRREPLTIGGNRERAGAP